MREPQPFKRVFVPARRYIGNTFIKTQVARWEWTRGHGIRCFYTDGTKSGSDYRSLRELFAGETVTETEKHFRPNDPGSQVCPHCGVVDAPGFHELGCSQAVPQEGSK